MKKLMTMIAAVATAFGLFADEPTYNGTSFESAEAGVTELKWTPASGVPAGTWSTNPTIEDALDLGEYDGDKYVYPTAAPRRDGSVATEPRQFEAGETNDNYLKLDTGSATVDRAVATAQVFYDQVIKFTGFEDMQTNFVGGTKIALWTSAIEDDEDTEEANEADTNLYVAVGNGLDGIRNVKIAVATDFDFNAWHRVTIKNAGVVSGENQLGFFVWIDGVMAQVVEADKGYFQGSVSAFKSYYDKGQLFISMNGTSATVEKIGFQGVGSLDDVVVDADGPAFAVLTVDVTFAPIAGAVIAEVKDADGVVEGKDGTYSVKPGNITVTLAADVGYKMFGKSVYTVDASAAGQKTITLDGTTFEEVVAMVVNADETVTNLYAESELIALTGLANGDTATILKGCSVKDAQQNVLYTFTKDTTIAVAAGGVWTVNVAKMSAVLSTITDNVGAFPGKDITLTFDSTAQKLLNIQGVIYGNDSIATKITAEDGTAKLVGNLGIGNAMAPIGNDAGAILKALAVNVNGNKIALVDGGKVITKSSLTEDDFTLPAGEKLEVVDAGDGWYTYQIKAAPTTGFMLLIGGVETYFPLLADAIAAASDGATITAVGELALQKGIYINKNMFPTQGLTIDLANTTYLVSKPGEGDKGTETQAFHIESGNKVTIKDGTIACPADMKDYTWAADAARDEKGISRMINNYGELTLNNVAVDASNMAKSFYGQGDARHAGTAYAVSGKNSGNLILTGNSSITAREAVEGYASYAFDTDTGVSVTVDGATINGDVELAAGNLALTAGTLNGKLVAGADNLGTVTKADGFTAAAPDGYKWVNGVLTKIDYATLTIKQVDHCTVVVSNADNTAEIKTGATFDKDLAVKLNVYRVAAEGYELDNCAATEQVTMTANYEATAAVKEKQAGPTSEEADIGTPDPSTGIYPVTPKNGATAVVIENGEGQRFSFPSTVKTIKGVIPEQVFIQGNGGHDITPLLTKTGDATTGVTYDLNPEAKDGDVPVKPTIEAVDTEFDIAGGTMEVKGIQGLYYSLVGSEDVKTVSTGAVCDTATVEKTGDTVSLTDEGTKGAAKFYVIKVSVDAPAAD